MEKHKCKLCFRSFSNGKALGGHMRSHMMNLPIPPKQNNSPPPPPPMIQLSFEADSGSSPSSSSFYGLRENPKRSFRFTDPNHIIDAGSIILQEDGGSESESSKNPTGKRSKRVKKIDPMKNSIQTNDSVLSSSSDITTEEDIAFCLMMMSRHNNNNNNWKTQHQNHQYQEQQNHHYHQYQEDQQEEEEQFNQYVQDEDEEEDEDVEEEEESEAEFEEEEEEVKPLKKVRGRYKCDTCNKVFRSYQALGGHRASHKKNMKLLAENGGDSISNHHDHKSKIENNNVVVNHNNNGEKRIHECPICFREFSSGQALGGHKRTHGIGIGNGIGSSAPASTPAPAATTTATTATVVTTTNVPTTAIINVEVVRRSSANFGESLIDLNLPADMDEDDEVDGDDVSQIEGSAVSDAEFVKP